MYKKSITLNSNDVCVCVICESSVSSPPTQTGGGRNSKAYAPKFPKTKDEGWWVLIGEVDTGELVALKRLGYLRSKTTTTLAFSTPEEPCRKIYSLFLVSDCYLGLDQQYEMCLNFVPREND